MRAPDGLGRLSLKRTRNIPADVRQLPARLQSATCLGYTRYDNFVLHRINRME